MTFELSLVLKATVLLSVGLIAVRLARRARASRRHLVLASVFAALAGLPIASTFVPAISIRLPIAATPKLMPAAATPLAVVAAMPIPSPQAETPSGETGWWWPSATTILRGLWAIGTAASLILFTASLASVRRLRRSAVPWIAGQSTAVAVAMKAGIHRPVAVMLHEQVAVPATIGFVRPVILLPPDAGHWPDDDLRRAFVHEIEHIRRGDWWGHLAARAVCCVYWFHPLVWVAWRQLGTEAERACDDAVLNGVDRADYADQLLTLAERLSTADAQPILSMANRSDLSVRVSAILNPRQRRGRPGVLAAAALIAIVAISGGAVASLRAVAAPDSPSGDGVALRGPSSDRSAEGTPGVDTTAGARSVHMGAVPAAGQTPRPVTPATAPNDAQGPTPTAPVQGRPVQIATAANPPTALDDYVIGAQDVLLVTFWQNNELSSEVLVRPDGKISLPFINDIVAAGLTIEELRVQVTARAARFLTKPEVTIVARAINSRNVFITGEVGKSGPYALTGLMTVMQLISTAGGLTNSAKRDSIFTLRQAAGAAVRLPFDYAAFVTGQKPEQNIVLKPGDTVVVP